MVRCHMPHSLKLAKQEQLRMEETVMSKLEFEGRFFTLQICFHAAHLRSSELERHGERGTTLSGESLE